MPKQPQPAQQTVEVTIEPTTNKEYQVIVTTPKSPMSAFGGYTFVGALKKAARLLDALAELSDSN